MACSNLSNSNGYRQVAERIYDGLKTKVVCARCGSRGSYVRDSGGKKTIKGLRYRQWRCRVCRSKTSCRDFVAAQKRLLGDAVVDAVAPRRTHDPLSELSPNVRGPHAGDAHTTNPDTAAPDDEASLPKAAGLDVARLEAQAPHDLGPDAGDPALEGTDAGRRDARDQIARGPHHQEATRARPRTLPVPDSTRPSSEDSIDEQHPGHGRDISPSRGMLPRGRRGQAVLLSRLYSQLGRGGPDGTGCYDDDGDDDDDHGCGCGYGYDAPPPCPGLPVTRPVRPATIRILERPRVPFALRLYGSWNVHAGL